MLFLTTNIVYELIVLLGIFIITIYAYFQYSYQYWNRKGVDVIEPPTFPFGNMGSTFAGKGTSAQLITRLYNDIKGPYAGFYMMAKPVLIVKDLECIKNIMVKDFNHFQDRFKIAKINKEDPFAEHMFIASGQKWRTLRHKLSPTFTSGKLKMMFQTFVECGNELESTLAPLAEAKEDIEIKEYVARFTTDIIGSVAFGIQCNSLKNPDAEFRKHGKNVFNLSFFKFIRSTFIRLVPFLLNFFKLTTTSKETKDFFTNVIDESVKYREENGITRNDFLQLMIQLKNKGVIESDEKEEDHGFSNDIKEIDNAKNGSFTMTDIYAQSFVFFLAGFETSSSTMMFCLYELSLQPEIQHKVQKEIDQVLAKSGGNITYDSIQEMDYLENVFSETLRKYPVLDALHRTCTKEYIMPNTGLVIEKGTFLIIPLNAMHHNPEIFPDPEKFDPDRFLPENKTWNNFWYMPFGEGPRNCIGARMGKIQTKIGLISILRKFDVSVCEKTPIPITFTNRHFIRTPAKEVILKISNRVKV